MTRCSSRSSRAAVRARAATLLAGLLLACAWAGCASLPPAGTVSPPPSTPGEGQTEPAADASPAGSREGPAPARAAGAVPPSDAAAPASQDRGDGAPPAVPPPATGTAVILGSVAGVPAAPEGPEDRRGGTTGSRASGAGTTAPGVPSPDPKSGAASGGLVLRLSAGPAGLQVGDSVTVEVQATATARIVDAPLHLDYDATRLRYVAGEEGDFLKRDGTGTVFLINGLSLPGVVTIGLGRLDRAHGLSGAGTHCRVRFEVIAPGASRVAVGQAMAWADDGSMLKVDTDAVEVSVPEP